MSSYAVKSFKVKKAKDTDAELEDFLNKLAKDGWTVVSVVPGGLKAKGAGFTSQRPDSFLVAVSRP